MAKAENNPASVIRSTIEEQVERIRKALGDRNLSKVAFSTGLHENTVRNLVRGSGGTPTQNTIEKLSKYLFG